MAPKTVLMIGGTGAQGVPIVKSLAADGNYTVHLLTRSKTSSEAIELASLPNITIMEGNALHEPTLLKAFHGVDAVFVNTNGFAIGEKSEIFWGIRLYALAFSAGVKHFVYSTVDYASKLGDFDPAFHCGHADGKGIVAECIRQQPTSPMAWTVFHTSAYAEILSEMLAPYHDPNHPDTMVFATPLGDAAMPLNALEDLGKYGRWVFDNVQRSNGMTLKISTEHIRWADLAEDYTEVTGQKAVYRDVTHDEYFSLDIFPDPEVKVGHSVSHDDDTLQTYRENFTAFWNMWKSGTVKRDYKLLDEILPDRIRSIKEWMLKTGYTGEPESVLKDFRDSKRS